MSRVSEAKEVIETCWVFRAALIRMRELLGGRHSATACERYAENILGKESNAALPSEETVASLAAAKLSLLQKVQAILGSRTMHLREVYAVLVDSKHEHESSSLLQDMRREVCRHTGSRGRQLFVRVRHGWYRNRAPSDPQVTDERSIAKNAFVQAIYDLMGTGAVGSKEMSMRLIRSGQRADRCDHAKVQSCMQANSAKGLRCFKRMGKGIFRRISGKRPEIEVPLNITVGAVESILGAGPLSIAEVQLRMNARRPDKPYSFKYVQQLLRNNSGMRGFRRFEKVAPGIYSLQTPDLLEQIMRVMNTGAALSPSEVQQRLIDMGYSFPVERVQSAMAKNAGFGFPLTRLRVGKYVKAIPGEK